MKRMSRAGRKQMIIGILHMRLKMGKTDSVTLGYIARKMGLKSSTYLKNIMKELEDENESIVSYDFSWGRAYRFRPLEQSSFLPARMITVNGMSMRAL